MQYCPMKTIYIQLLKKTLYGNFYLTVIYTVTYQYHGFE